MSDRTVKDKSEAVLITFKPELKNRIERVAQLHGDMPRATFIKFAVTQYMDMYEAKQNKPKD